MAVAIAASFPTSTHSQSATPGQVRFSCTFANSPTDCGFVEQGKWQPRATIVSGGRDGGTALRLHTEPGDNYVHGSGTWERNDVYLQQWQTECFEGVESWWSHSVLFPADYVTPPVGGDGFVFTFHDTANSGYFNYAVAAGPDGLRIRGYGGPWAGAGKFESYLGPVKRDAWYDFVYQVRWSSGSDGYFNAWVNGVQKLAHRGPTLYRGQGCYLKLSNLHTPFGQASSVLHDRVMRGTSRESVWPSAPPPVVAVPTPTPTPTPTPLPEGELVFYVDPNSAAKQEAQRLRGQGSFSNAALVDKIANNPQARWFGSWNWDVRADVDAYVSAAAASSAVPVLVAYNIPFRDCGGYSAGGAGSPDAYRAWIRAMADGIAGRKAMVVLEPDALALNTCLPEAGKSLRNTLIKEAIATLKAKGARVYIDAGHANWVNDADMAGRLVNAGVAQADGFSVNVSNFIGTDPSVDYGNRISARIAGKHFVVDTSRNARGSKGEWCNPWGRGLGQRPTSATGKPLVDAYLWVKRPGESDGNCNGGPSAGAWWTDMALELSRNAVF